MQDENYCPKCGQKNTDLNISVVELIKDFSGDYFTFDSKFFNTIGPLIYKPGKVPKEYIDGQRVNHIPPLRAFIFLSFITFFLWGLSFNRTEGDENNSEDTAGLINVTDSAIANEALVDSLKNADIFSIGTIEDSLSDDSISGASMDYIFDKSNSPRSITDSLASIDSTIYKSEIIKRFIFQSLRIYQAEEGVALKYFMGNLSIVLLFLQPFFALLLKLVYIRRKSFYYIEHLVFSLYFHAFILITTIVFYILSLYFNSDYFIFCLFLLSILYLYLAIKRFYAQSWGKTIIKGFIVSFLYLVIVFPAFILGYFVLSLYFY